MKMLQNKTTTRHLKVPCSERKKLPFYKKLIGVVIMVAVAMYYIPELQEALYMDIRGLKDKWRK